jgi:tetratricopeptide (TPR) repeat protein
MPNMLLWMGALFLVLPTQPFINEPLPQELSSLSSLADDEQKLVQTVRDFDWQQRALIEWDQKLAAEYMMAGEEELKEDKLAAAEHRLGLIEKAYNYVLSKYPDNPRALTYQGELLYDLKRFDAAIKNWLKAERFDPEFPEPLNNLAIHYCHQGQYDKGLGYFEKTIELEPDNPDFLFNLVQIYLIHPQEIEKRYKWDRAKVFREAMKMSAQALKLKPDDYDLAEDYAVNFFAAERFGVDVDWQKAAEAWQQVASMASEQDKYFFAILNQARAWLRKPDKEKAAEKLREALKIHPDSAAAQKLLTEATS